MFLPASLLAGISGCSGPYSSLDPQGPAAAEVATLWWLMFGFFSLVLLIVAGLWHYAIKRRGNSASGPAGSSWIIWGGLALPMVSITVLLIIGVPVGLRMTPQHDENAVRINVTGHQWYWQISYPELDSQYTAVQSLQLTDEIHIPVNTPVHLHLTSADVIHAFWVPRLGVKLDLLPGRTNILRLEASAPGVYRGQCAEYCGVGHAHMQFTVTAHSPDDFATWLKERVAAQRHSEQKQEATLDE